MTNRDREIEALLVASCLEDTTERQHKRINAALELLRREDGGAQCYKCKQPMLMTPLCPYCGTIPIIDSGADDRTKARLAAAKAGTNRCEYCVSGMSEPICGNMDTCTRKSGHGGNHVACSNKHNVHAWSEQPAAPEADGEPWIEHEMQQLDIGGDWHRRIERIRLRKVDNG